MARASFPTFTIFLFLFFFTAPILRGNIDLNSSFTKILKKKEKLTHIQCYLHDIYSGPNPTTKVVVPPISNTSSTLFGSMIIMDDPLTLGPELSSKTIGNAQGMYASASQETSELLMILNFVFTNGKYKGSTVAVIGRNEVFTKVRELPVVSGSRIFRFARGYVQARTHKFNTKTGNAIVKYDMYILHY